MLPKRLPRIQFIRIKDIFPSVCPDLPPGTVPGKSAAAQIDTGSCGIV
jgi:hypothetical protein